MASPSRTCWICGAPANIWSHAAARTCDACQENPDERLRNAGFAIVEGFEHPFRTLEITAPSATSPTIRLAFSEEGFGSMFKKFFKSELQVGVKAFDDEVYLQYADEKDLWILARHEVGELMKSLCKLGTISIENGKASVVVTNRETPLPPVALLTASLLFKITELQAQP